LKHSLFVIALIALGSATAPGWAQQESSPVPDSARQQAVNAVLKHYAINPRALDPKTQQPLPRDGSWSTGKMPPASCPQSKDPCVEVLYLASANNVKCSWVVLLNGDGTDGTFLDQNDDAERYLIRRVSPNEAKTLVASRKKPIYPAIAIAAHVKGPVVMNLLVGRVGEVQAATIISGPPMVQQVAIDAARAWTFKPLMVGMRAVPYEVQLVLDFETSGPPDARIAMTP